MVVVCFDFVLFASRLQFEKSETAIPPLSFPTDMIGKQKKYEEVCPIHHLQVGYPG